MDNLLEQFKSEHKEEIEEAQKKIIDLNNPIVATPEAENLPVTGETKTVEQIIEDQKQRDLTAIQQDENFQKASHELNFRDAESNLTSKALIIADKELSNQYEKYKLDQKKELLHETIKAEKGLIKEQAKAEKYDKKRKIAEKRYGYLYDTTEITILDDEGNKITKTVYKEFTPSKAINRFKEFNNWYVNLTDGARKFIETSCKTILKLGFWAALGGAIYGLVMWLLNSGVAV